jgi:hypothetical protein
VHAFVRPGRHADEELSLLLGLPWLHDIDAHFGTRDSVVRIGDREKGEKPTKLRGPLFIPST